MAALDAQCKEGTAAAQAERVQRLRPVEGTIILHFSFAVQQDQV